MKEKRAAQLPENRARAFCAELGIDVENNWFVVAVGLSAISDAFQLAPDAFGLDAVFFRDLKPSLLREIDGVEMVLTIEKAVGKFLAPDNARLLAQIRGISVGEWLGRLVIADWVVL